jgi:hypothetical protein
MGATPCEAFLLNWRGSRRPTPSPRAPEGSAFSIFRNAETVSGATRFAARLVATAGRPVSAPTGVDEAPGAHPSGADVPLVARRS